jgi:hypothetical protein
MRIERSMTMKRIMIGIAMIAVWATAASAQEPLLVSRGSVEVGDRLRATYLPDPTNTDREATVTGEYAGLGPAELRLSTSLPSGELVREVDLDEILRLERSRRRTVGEGAGRGALWGAVAGALFGFGVIAACSGDDFLQCGGSDFIVGSAIFAGMGAGAGAAIGMAARGTTWEEVQVPASH